MAQPPETINETFLREVDENLRRDRARDFAKRYGNWVIVGVLLFLLAAGGWIYWQNLRQKRSEQQVEQLAEIYQKVGTTGAAKAGQQLEPLGRSGSKAVAASALFAGAAVALEGNDQKAAVAKYRAIAGGSDYPQPYRDAALIRQTALEFDSLTPDQVIARLSGLAKPGNPWFGSAGEMTAMALIKQGKKDEAGRLFAAIAKDKSVPQPLRARSVQVAGSLGVDASGALQSPAQQDQR